MASLGTSTSSHDEWRDPVLSARRGVSPVMVGRAGSLARLTGIVEAAEVAAGDEAAVALISGEPGIGKTRLVDEFVRSIAETGEQRADVVVLRAEHGSLGRSFHTFAPLLQNADDGDEARADARRPVAEDPGAADRRLVELFGSRHRRGTPLVLVIEDVHWIDAASASMVSALVSQPWPSFVLVATCRTGELRHGSPGGDLVLGLERRHVVEQVRLQRLDRNEVDAMIAAITGADPHSAKVEAVYRRSDGVPFVVEELVRAVQRETRDDRAAAVSSVELPWSLNDAVEQQLGNLSSSERLVAKALAVYHDHASFEMLAALTDLDDDSLIEALRGLVDHDVLAETSDDRIWFVHALTADSIEQQLLSRERRRLHERCFDVLSSSVLCAEEEAAKYSTLAHHAIGAGRFDEVPDIARQGATSALQSGATFLALRLAATGLNEVPDDAPLLAVATEAGWRLNFTVEACEMADRWVAVAEGPQLVDALRLQSRSWYERGDFYRGADALNDLANLASDMTQPREVRATAAAGVAQLHMLEWRPHKAVEWADRAIAEASTIGDKLTIARATIERASSLFDIEPPSRAMGEMERGIEMARAADDPVAVARGINNLLCHVPAHTDRGRELVDELSVVAKQAGLDKLDAKASGWERFAAWGVGDMAAARRALGQAVSRRFAPIHNGGWLTNDQAMMAVEEGRFDVAQRLFDDEYPNDDDDVRSYVRRVAGHHFDQYTTMLQLAAFRDDREAGATAWALLLSRLPPVCHWEMTDRLVCAIDAALSLGIPPTEIRERVLDNWLTAYPSVDDVRGIVQGLLQFAEDDLESAVQSLDKVAFDGRLQAPTRAGLAMCLARALVALGDRERAVAVLDQMIDVDLARWPGVRRDRAEELRRRLRRARPSRSGADGESDGDAKEPGAPGSTGAQELTRREREVAALLAEGLTNGQVAERLYISPKTAAVHVSNILAKLGLSSRAEIAAWAVRNVLDAQSAQ